MKLKKSIAIIITLLLILLPMMTLKVSAANINTVYNVKAEKQGNAVNMQWSPVTNADGYDVFVNIARNGFQYLGSVRGAGVRISGFKSSVSYSVKVRAYKKATNGVKEVGSFSAPIDIDMSEKTTLNKVQNLTASQNNGKVTLNWSKVSGATKYEVYVSTSNSSSMLLGKVSGNNVIVSGCQEGITYNFKIRACSGTNMYGAFSEEKSVYIAKKNNNNQVVQETKPANVTGARLSSIEENKAYVTWNKSNNATGYEVWVKMGNGSYNYQKDISKTNITIAGLNYNTSYSVRIIAYNIKNNKKVYCEDAGIVNFTTKSKKQLEAVTHLNVTVQNRNEAKLTWWKVDGAYGYEIYLSESGKTFQKVADTLSNNIMLYSNNLNYNTQYRVKVVAYEYVNGKKQYGKYSSIVNFKTERQSNLEGNSSVPRVQNLRANVTGSIVKLSWGEVKNAVKYEIEFKIPGYGGTEKFTVYTNSKTIGGLTDKKYNYTARVRAYKYVNGKLVAGEYSYVTEFKAK